MKHPLHDALNTPPHPKIIKEGKLHSEMMYSKAKIISYEWGYSLEDAIKIANNLYDRERRDFFEWLSKQDPATRYTLSG